MNDEVNDQSKGEGIINPKTNMGMKRGMCRFGIDPIGKDDDENKDENGMSLKQGKEGFDDNDKVVDYETKQTIVKPQPNVVDPSKHIPFTAFHADSVDNYVFTELRKSDAFNKGLVGLKQTSSRMLSYRYNKAVTDDNARKAETDTNYMPYGPVVGLDVIATVTINDILRCKTLPEILSSCKGDVYKDGVTNPALRVNAINHMTQGLTVGDYIDLNHVPDAVRIRGCVDGSANYEEIRDEYVRRNPLSNRAFSIADSKSRVLSKDGIVVDKDLDDVNQKVQLVFKGVVENYNICGIYFNKNIPVKVDGFRDPINHIQV